MSTIKSIRLVKELKFYGLFTSNLESMKRKTQSWLANEYENRRGIIEIYQAHNKVTRQLNDWIAIESISSECSSQIRFERYFPA